MPVEPLIEEPDIYTMLSYQFLAENTRTVLYLFRDTAAEVADRLNGLITERYAATDFAGLIKFSARAWSKGRHNWGIPRMDIWFQDHQDSWWWGVHYGYQNDLLYCKKLKKPPWWADLLKKERVNSGT